jgi:hypothetical protein
MIGNELLDETWWHGWMKMMIWIKLDEIHEQKYDYINEIKNISVDFQE